MERTRLSCLITILGRPTLVDFQSHLTGSTHDTVTLAKADFGANVHALLVDALVVKGGIDALGRRRPSVARWHDQIATERRDRGGRLQARLTFAKEMSALSSWSMRQAGRGRSH